VGRGIFATNVLVLQGAQEFVCDFLLRMVPPYMLAARVVLPYSNLGPFTAALEENLNNYRARFQKGPPTLPPPPPNVQPPRIDEVYEQLKIPEDVAVGAYANTVMITHTAAEFCFDFILDLFPRPTVTCRVYVSAPQVPGLLDTLKRTLVQLQARVAAQAAQQQAQSQPKPPEPPAVQGPPTATS